MPNVISQQSRYWIGPDSFGKFERRRNERPYNTGKHLCLRIGRGAFFSWLSAHPVYEKVGLKSINIFTKFVNSFDRNALQSTSNRLK